MSAPETPAEVAQRNGNDVTSAPATSTPTPRHLLIIIGGVFAVSLLKGLRMPNLWAATHMTFNYTHGFTRRGLFGQVLHLIAGDRIYRYNTLALLAVILFVAAAAAMIRLIRRTLASADVDGGDRGLIAMTLVFAASPGIVFLAHEIGYLDYVGLIVVPIFIVWAARTRGLWLIFYVAAAISVVLALIHESMIIMFAPTLLLAMVAHVVTQARARGLGRRTVGLMAAHAALATVIALAASSLVGTLGTRTPEQVHALQSSIGRVANFPLRTDAFDVLYRPVRDNLLRVMPWFWSFPDNQRYLTTGLAVTLPGLAVLGAYALRFINRLALSRSTRLLLASLFLVATFSPLLLNFVGWDAARWNAICFVAAFNGIAILRLFFGAYAPAGDVRRLRVDDPLMLTLAAAVIVFGLTSNYGGFLFDGYVVQWFPFDGQLRSLLELFHGNFTFIPRG